MTKEEIALELTKEFKGFIKVASPEENAKNIVNFYNTVFDGIKTERAERREHFA